jgi:isoquinoline 1-oxidoreductase beta subunit
VRTTRREILRWSALSGAALILALPRDNGGSAEVLPAPPSPFAPNPWIRIGSDGAVALVVARAEMGQGVRTSLAMLLAEELEVDLSTVKVLQASPGPDYRRMRTGGSASVQGGFTPLRKAGAAAREMLIGAAAEGWGVAPFACRAQDGHVLHPASGRRKAYGELVGSAAKRDVPKEPRLKDPKEFRILGRSHAKVDGPDIVSGRAVYGLDVRVPGMLVAALARPPVPGGRPLHVDTAGVRSLPGVRQVVSVPSGIAVLADDTWTALKGRDALEIKWDDGPNGHVDSAAHWRRLEEASDRTGYRGRHEGDAAAALATSARTLSAIYRFPFQAHLPVEPMNAIAHVSDGGCEIWVGTQAANQAQELAARKLGLPLDKVKVHMALLGGGFGRRLAIDYVGEAVDVSKAVRRPVQVVWNHADDARHGHVQPASVHRLAAGLDASGRLVAWTHRVAGSFLTILEPVDLTSPTLAADNAWGSSDYPYAIPNAEVEFVPVETPLPTGPWRAVFYPPCIFARESFLDEAAHAGGRDPLAYRLELLAPRDVFKVFDYTIDRGRQARVLELAAEKAGWGRPLPGRPGRRTGRGLACNVYDSDTYIAQIAEVSVGGDGDVRVHRVVTALDAGFIVNPLGVEGQVEGGVIWGLSATLHGEITLRNGRVLQSGYSDFPVLGIEETPALETYLVPSTAKAAGVCEPPVPCVAPAVANAVFAATGRRVRRLPIRSADLA